MKCVEKYYLSMRKTRVLRIDKTVANFCSFAIVFLFLICYGSSQRLIDDDDRS